MKCAASVGVNEQVGRTDVFCGAGVEFDALVLEVWFGPGDGLLWLLEERIKKKSEHLKTYVKP